MIRNIFHIFFHFALDKLLLWCFFKKARREPIWGSFIVLNGKPRLTGGGCKGRRRGGAEKPKRRDRKEKNKKLLDFVRLVYGRRA